MTITTFKEDSQSRCFITYTSKLIPISMPHYQLLRLHFFPVLQGDEIRPTRIIHRRDGQIADGDTPQYLTAYHLPRCRFDFYGRIGGLWELIGDIHLIAGGSQTVIQNHPLTLDI